MRRLVFALGALGGAAVTACGNAPSDVPVVANPRLLVLDGTSATNVTAFDDHLSFPLAGNAWLLQRQVGDVIACSTICNGGDGLLRKVASISQVGDAIVMATEQAALNDAIQEGSWSFQVDLARQAENGGPRLPGAISLPAWSLASDKTGWQISKTTGISLSLTHYSLQYSGLSLSFIGRVLPGGFVFGESPWLDVGVGFHGSFSTDIGFDFQLDPGVGGQKTTAGIEGEALISNDSLAFRVGQFGPWTLWAGEVPVVVAVAVELLPTYTASADANVGFTGDVTFSGTIDVNAEAQLPGGFTYTNGSSLSLTGNTAETQHGANVQVGAGAAARLLVQFYGIGGPYLQPNFLVAAKGAVKLDCTQSPDPAFSWALGGTIPLSWGGEFKLSVPHWGSFDWGQFSWSSELYSNYPLHGSTPFQSASVVLGTCPAQTPPACQQACAAGQCCSTTLEKCTSNAFELIGNTCSSSADCRCGQSGGSDSFCYQSKCVQGCATNADCPGAQTCTASPAPGVCD